MLLTGATGLIGSHLLDELLNETACDVMCLVRPKLSAEELKQCSENDVAEKTYQRLVTSYQTALGKTDDDMKLLGFSSRVKVLVGKTAVLCRAGSVDAVALKYIVCC